MRPTVQLHRHRFENNIDMTWQQKLNYVVVLFGSLDNLKMTVVTFGKTAVHAHIRIRMSVLLKMN